MPERALDTAVPVLRVGLLQARTANARGPPPLAALDWISGDKGRERLDLLAVQAVPSEPVSPLPC